MSFFENIIDWFNGLVDTAVTGYSDMLGTADSKYNVFTAFARWIFIFLALFILAKAIISLWRSKSPTEVWGYLQIEGGDTIPLTHWENAIGRSKSCDIRLMDMRVSKNHGILTTEGDGHWFYTDIGSSNGAKINGVSVKRNVITEVRPGEDLVLGETLCRIIPISLEEKNNNRRLREADTKLANPWASLVALTIFQVLAIIEFKGALGDDFTSSITISFVGLSIVMWAYYIIMTRLKRRAFEMETIAFFLSTMSLCATASKYPEAVIKQFIAIVIGLCLFFGMCVVLRNIKLTIKLKKIIYVAAGLILLFNLAFATTKFGQSNWVVIGGISFQPSEFVKLAYIWVGAATMDELFQKKNSLIFMLFSGFCFICLALMGDFGTAAIFFVTFLVISFLRSGDFTKLILVVGVAFVGGLMVLKFKSYVAGRFAVWGHVWEHADDIGYQMTRTMSASASGGLVGLGGGRGWLSSIPASDTDLVFGLITEEWGLIIAILMILSIVTLAIFAVRSIWSGRSTYYTIAACSAMSLFVFQTILNVFGSVDLLPLTGVTFPFVSNGGTSMVASWGMLAFLKAADTRQNASFAIKLGEEKELISDRIEGEAFA